MAAVTIDAAIESANGIGKFQILMFIYISLLTHLPGGMLSVVSVFISHPPEWECNEEGPSSSTNGTDAAVCNQDSNICEIDRDLWRYTKPDETISAEWDLICSQEWKVGTVASSWFIGYLAGVGIFGALSDSRGRRTALIISTLLASFFGTLSGFSPSLELMTLFRTVAGAGCGGNTLAGFLLATESMSTEWSGLLGIGFSSFFPLSLILLAGVGSWEPRWRQLVIISALSNLFMLPFLKLLPESPRWQLASGDTAGAVATIERFARVNGRSFASPVSLAAPTTASPSKNAPPPGVCAVCHSPVLRRRLLAMMYVWFACSFSYYGLSLNVGNLSGSTALNLAYSGLSELPALSVAAFGVRGGGGWGRRSLLLAFLLPAGLSCMIAAGITVPDDCADACFEGQLLRNLALGGRMAIAGGFALTYVYAAEMFPTLVRSMTMGLCSQAARMGGIVAPAAVLSASVSPALPLTLFGMAALGSVGATLLLPETKGVVVPESIQELDAMENKRRAGAGGKGDDEEEGLSLLVMGGAGRGGDSEDGEDEEGGDSDEEHGGGGVAPESE